MNHITLSAILLAVYSATTPLHAAESEAPLQPDSSTTTVSRIVEKGLVPVSLIATGFIVKGEDTHFRSLRNDYVPSYKHPYDNYTQFLPAAVMLGMKACGVKGRSSWGRMLVSDAFSTAIMAATVQYMKMNTNVHRPDGSNNHSFPSGHTATAFMTATMLTKEYGHISPWIGIGSYTVATATGIMRVTNNKHWLSDVLTGAGIGILATEVGYWLGDVIFRDRGIRRIPTHETSSSKDAPSFLGLYLGMNVPLSHYDIDEEHTFRTSSGSSAGLEGAWFFCPYVGVGGRFTISNTHIITNGNEAEKNNFDIISMMGGAYFSYPLGSRWLVGSKLLVGGINYPTLHLDDGTTVDKRDGIGFGSGLSIAYKAREHYGMRLFLDYNLLPSHSKKSSEWMNMLSAGTSFMVTF